MKATECPFRAYGKRCTFKSSAGKMRTNSKKSAICPYKNCKKCPIYKSHWCDE